MTNAEKEAALKARKDYFRAWRSQNRDKVREYNLRYWAKRAANMTKEGGAANESTESAPGD